MDCPKCLGVLEEKNVEKVKVDICWICEGIWFDSGELEKVLEADSKDFNMIDVGRDSLDGKETVDLHEDLDNKIGKCPRCENDITLERSSYKKGLILDRCPTCNGIWLDGGEIQKLRHRTLVNIIDKIWAIKTVFIEDLQKALHGWKKEKNDK